MRRTKVGKYFFSQDHNAPCLSDILGGMDNPQNSISGIIKSQNLDSSSILKKKEEPNHRIIESTIINLEKEKFSSSKNVYDSEPSIVFSSSSSGKNVSKNCNKKDKASISLKLDESIHNTAEDDHCVNNNSFEEDYTYSNIEDNVKNQSIFSTQQDSASISQSEKGDSPIKLEKMNSNAPIQHNNSIIECQTFSEPSPKMKPIIHSPKTLRESPSTEKRPSKEEITQSSLVKQYSLRKNDRIPIRKYLDEISTSQNSLITTNVEGYSYDEYTLSSNDDILRTISETFLEEEQYIGDE